MRIAVLVVASVVLLVGISSGQDHVEDLLKSVRGPYLGQAPPGDSAVPFFPELFIPAYESHDCPVFSDGGCHMLLGVMEGPKGFVEFRYDGGWSTPTEVVFETVKDFEYTMAPCMTPDGAMVYFHTFSSPTAYTIPHEGRYHAYIWYARLENGKWVDPQPVDSSVNALNMHWQFSVAASRNLYITPRNDGMIYRSVFSGGRYSPPEVLNGLKEGNYSTPFVAPDESYIIFAEDSDLSVIYRMPDSTWSGPVCLGDRVCTPDDDICPNVTPDGKYLFFVRAERGWLRPYWVDAGIIQRLSQKFEE